VPKAATARAMAGEDLLQEEIRTPLPGASLVVLAA